MFLILQPVIVFPSPIGEVEVWYVCCFQIGSFAIEGRRDCLELIRGEWGKVREVFALIWKMCQLVASTKTLVMVTILSTTFTINQLTVTPTRLSLITDTQFCFLLHLDIPYLLSFRNTGSSESVFLKVTSKSSIWYRPSTLKKEECTWSWHLLFFSPARKNATVHSTVQFTSSVVHFAQESAKRANCNQCSSQDIFCLLPFSVRHCSTYFIEIPNFLVICSYLIRV